MAKKILTFTLLLLAIQVAFTQSCETYTFNCVGTIKSESLKIKKIKLPTVDYLMGKETQHLKNDFISIEGNKIDNMLMGFQYATAPAPQKLLDYLKSKRESIPIIILTEKDGKTQEKTIKIKWSTITLQKTKNDFQTVFELDINEIII